MEKNELPCCGPASTRHVTGLPHVYQFDFDLEQCEQCDRYWVRASRMGVRGWEAVTAADAEKMRTLDDEELHAFMRKWAYSLG